MVSGYNHGYVKRKTADLLALLVAPSAAIADDNSYPSACERAFFEERWQIAGEFFACRVR